jgi:hypothetical protein
LISLITQHELCPYVSQKRSRPREIAARHLPISSASAAIFCGAEKLGPLKRCRLWATQLALELGKDLQSGENLASMEPSSGQSMGGFND